MQQGQSGLDVQSSTRQGEMDLGAGSGAAFGRQNVAARRSPLDHQNVIKLVLRAKQNKLCAEGIGFASAGLTQSDPNDRVVMS